MRIVVNRKWFYPTSTIGEMTIDTLFECFTLEDLERETKIRGKTAIPLGEYKLILDYSNRFKRIMPHILDVPGFEGIRIHSGNTDADTEGCILVGKNKNNGTLGLSRIAFANLMVRLNEAIYLGEDITIQIVKEIT